MSAPSWPTRLFTSAPVPWENTQKSNPRSIQSSLSCSLLPAFYAFVSKSSIHRRHFDAPSPATSSDLKPQQQQQQQQQDQVTEASHHPQLAAATRTHCVIFFSVGFFRPHCFCLWRLFSCVCARVSCCLAIWVRHHKTLHMDCTFVPAILGPSHAIPQSSFAPHDARHRSIGSRRIRTAGRRRDKDAHESRSRVRIMDAWWLVSAPGMTA